MPRNSIAVNIASVVAKHIRGTIATRAQRKRGRFGHSCWRCGLVCGLLVSADALCLPAVAEDSSHWPQFRGPGSVGFVESSELPDRWSATENVAWKTAIAGRGWSSPVVWGHRVFVTTAVGQGELEDPKKGLYFGGDRKEIPTSDYLWQVLCLDLEGGQVLWESTAHAGKPESSVHLKNTFASETPVTDGERLYVSFGNVGIFCYDLDGNPLWSKLTGARKMRLGWGTAASPALHGDRLYLCNDNEEESYLLALDTRTGDEVWRVARNEKSNWATPLVWRHEGRTEIVTAGTNRVRSYDLDGKELWELGGMSAITIATPYAQNGLLYVSSGYVLDWTRPIYAIKPGASGDISLASEAKSNEFIAWSDPKAGPYNPTTLVYRGVLYALLDRGLLAAYDAATGEMLYEPQRIEGGTAFTASPWAYDGKVFCLSEDGATYVLEAGREFKPLHTNALAEDDMCLATPAIAGKNLLIRSLARVYCIRSPQ